MSELLDLFPYRHYKNVRSKMIVTVESCDEHFVTIKFIHNGDLVEYPIDRFDVFFQPILNDNSIVEKE